MQKIEGELHSAGDVQRWAAHKEHSNDLQQQIRVRAYELYELRGAGPGHELEDWTRAESEITNQKKLAQAA
jgi:hypothetical protein